MDERKVFKSHGIKLLEYFEGKTIVEYKKPKTTAKLVIHCDRVLLSRQVSKFKQKNINPNLKNGTIVILVEGENFHYIEILYGQRIYRYYKSFPHEPIDVIMNKDNLVYILCANNYLFMIHSNTLIKSDDKIESQSMNWYISELSEKYFKNIKIFLNGVWHRGEDVICLEFYEDHYVYTNAKISINGNVMDFTADLHSCIVNNFRSSLSFEEIKPNEHIEGNIPENS